MAKETDFEEHRPTLFALAYRMLGSVADAEDVVQEAFIRWSRTDRNSVVSTLAFLRTVVTRLCIDHLRAARARREEYIGPWLPEPLVTSSRDDPAHLIELSESLSLAFLLLLETLSPVERAVFLLHEVFDEPYDAVAEAVGKAEANCRQIARRARERIAAGKPRFEPLPAERDKVLQRFTAACTNGDIDGLLAVLAADAVLISDGGGKVTAARRPVIGADNIARFLLGVLRKAPEGLETEFAQINGQPGIVVRLAGRPFGAWSLQIADGTIQRIYAVVNPDKLTRL